MITLIRREIKNLSRVAPNDAILERIRDTESSIDHRSSASSVGEDVSQVHIDLFVNLLCDCIKIKDVELSILALHSTKNLVDNQVINAKSLQLIVDTLTKIEFTSTESELVEEGYFQAVRVCCALIKCTSSYELTNGSVSEMIIFCFRVVNSKLVKWLRSKAARALMSITTIVFRRLSEFPEDPNLKPSYQIRLRLGGASSQSTFKELADQSMAITNNVNSNNTSSNNSNENSSSSSSTLRIINERNQPFNLAFVNDFFGYLASLINPVNETDTSVSNQKLQEDKIVLGLRLLQVAFKEAAEDIGQKSCLIHITRNNICCNIVSILKTSRSTPIVNNALNFAVDIFIKLRHNLKYQLEAFLERLMEILVVNTEQSQDINHHNLSHHNYIQPSSPSSLSQNSGAILELRSYVLNTVLELFRNIDHFPHELYYNYDCDPYSSNIYENLVQICSKNCFQHSTIETHFTPIQLTSFKCLLTNLADIYSVETGVEKCFTTGSNFIFSDIINNYLKGNNQLQQQHLVDNNINCKIRSKFPKSYRDLIEAKKRKRLLWLALDKFNARPKDGIQFIKENQLIDNNVDLVGFLRDNLRVDKKVLGEFLSKEENRPMRQEFITSLDFNNLRIDEALRSMLEKFRLPGESQMIERILDTFSTHWFEQNKGILPDSDSALSLAYAIIMLNVDQHSKKVKPMTCDEFDRNLSGPKGERVYDRKLLDQIYTNIRDNEIVLPGEQVGMVRQRYLWKCTMVKSDRIEAVYWITTPRVSSQPAVSLQQQQPEHNNNDISNYESSFLHSHNHPTSCSIISPTKLSPQTPMIQADETIKLPNATVLVISEPECVDEYQRHLHLNNLPSAHGADSSPMNFMDQSPPKGFDEAVARAAVQMRELPLVELNRILFEVMWSPTIAALSFIFDKIDTSIYMELSKQIVNEGFMKFAHLCAKHGHLDNLVVSLCKFTTDLSPIPTHNHLHMMSDKNSLAALSLLSIIRDYSNSMRDSWSNIVRNILQWYCSKCIDDVVQVDDFALQRKLRLRMRDIKKSPSTMNQQSSTFLRSVYTYFAGQPNANETKSSNGDGGFNGGSGSGNGGDMNGGSNTSVTSNAPSAVQVLLQTIQDSEYCQDSLVELIAALTTTTIDGDPEEVEDAEVFKLEIFTQVILNNKDQASSVWPRIRAYFARQSSICGQSGWLGERIISASFRVAIQFKPKPEVFSLLGQIIATLDADIVRGDHTFVALMTLTELHSPSVSMDAKELEGCFNQVIFPFLEKVLDGCDVVSLDRTLNRAINLLSKIFLKHHKLLKDLPTFALLWYAILDLMEKYIKANSGLKEATFELVKNMVLVMDNEQCMSVEMKDITRTKFMFWGEFPSGSDY